MTVDLAITRRAFLGISAGAAAIVFPAAAKTPRKTSFPEPAGLVCGFVGPRGLPPGTADAPARGDVVLLDGRILTATHVSTWSLPQGRSVLLTPEAKGRWGILYAEVDPAPVP